MQKMGFATTLFEQEQFDLDYGAFLRGLESHAGDLEALMLQLFSDLWGGTHHSYNRYVRKGAQHHRIRAVTLPELLVEEAQVRVFADVEACVFEARAGEELEVRRAETDADTTTAHWTDPESRDDVVVEALLILPQAESLALGDRFRVRVVEPCENRVGQAHLSLLVEPVAAAPAPAPAPAPPHKRARRAQRADGGAAPPPAPEK